MRSVVAGGASATGLWIDFLLKPLPLDSVDSYSRVGQDLAILGNEEHYSSTWHVSQVELV